MTTPPLVEHFFRHEYGRLVAKLSSRVGVEHVEDIEDAVQSALMAAIENWTIAGLPNNPSAWLFRVANNHLLGELRKHNRRRHLLQNEYHAEAFVESPESNQASESALVDDAYDDLLQMLFACCDESIPVESQLVFALKTLCGFSVREIAIRLFTSEANVYKRLTRSRNRLRELQPRFGTLPSSEYSLRIASVHKVLYLIFTEGYLSSDPGNALRLELCDEAIRPTEVLANHAVGKFPETFALVALMHLQISRMSSRQDDAGGLLLLEEQDRRLWDHNRIRKGLEWLAKSAAGDTFSRYHAEAGIAAEHCLAPSFHETRWDKIEESYALLEQFTNSPLHRLNRAVALAEWQGPAIALDLLNGFEPPTWLAGSYLWAAVLSDLHRRSGNMASSRSYREVAYKSAPSQQVKQLLMRRLEPKKLE